MIHGLYYEVEPMLARFTPRGIRFFYVCGGRGLGKTYSALDVAYKIGTGKWFDVEQNGRFLYLRRSRVEAESCASPATCPFKKYNDNEGTDVTPDFNTKLGYGTFYLNRQKEQKIGYLASLSTFSNLRGIDFSDVTLILYDECVCENPSKAPLPREGTLFMNMVETVSRNRTIEGKTEPIVLLLSNPIDLGAPILTGTGLTAPLASMIVKGQQRYTDPTRSLHIEKLTNHKVSELKAEASLYKFAKGTGFIEESLSGDFTNNDMTVVKDTVKLSQYKPICAVENVYVYQHRVLPELYITTVSSPVKITFRASEKEKIRKLVYWKYKLALTEGTVFFDSYATKAVFDNLVGYSRRLAETPQ